MGIITKTATIKLNSRHIKRLIELGYDLPMHYDKSHKRYAYNLNEEIEIKVEDLPKGSHHKIICFCDICGEQKELRYETYNKFISNDSEGLYRCHSCSFEKQHQTNIQKYGTDNVFKLTKFQDKARLTKKQNAENDPDYYEKIKNKKDNTMLQRYNVINPMFSEEIKNKMKQNSLEKNGVEYPIQLEEVRKKRDDTIKRIYNVDNISQLDEIKEKKANTLFLHYGVRNIRESEELNAKIRNTNLSRYGGITPMASLTVREKQVKSLWDNNSGKASKQQRYICNLYNGLLNYPISAYSVDIALLEDNIICEVDFSGHDLSVRLGQKTEEEFKQSEIIRGTVLKRKGFKVIHLISHTDKLPSNKVLLDILEQSKQYFNETSHTWREWDIDNGVFRDAEHKDGEPYDFGTLRSIKKKDLEIASQSL